MIGPCVSEEDLDAEVEGVSIVAHHPFSVDFFPLTPGDKLGDVVGGIQHFILPI